MSDQTGLFYFVLAEELFQVRLRFFFTSYPTAWITRGQSSFQNLYVEEPWNWKKKFFPPTNLKGIAILHYYMGGWEPRKGPIPSSNCYLLRFLNGNGIALLDRRRRTKKKKKLSHSSNLFCLFVSISRSNATGPCGVRRGWGALLIVFFWGWQGGSHGFQVFPEPAIMLGLRLDLKALKR